MHLFGNRLTRASQPLKVVLTVMQIVAHEFAPRDLVAGHPALDFVNTVTARDAAEPLDWLDSYDRLLDWTGLARIADVEILTRLRDLAAKSPERAARAIARARRFREALHDVLAALACGQAVPARQLSEVEETWKQAIRRTRLVPQSGQVRVTVGLERSDLNLIVDRIALSAVELMRDIPAARTRVCRGSRCGWLFIDTSKGGRRTWCDMATCGNAAKLRRLQERQRGPKASFLKRAPASRPPSDRHPN